MIDRLLISVSLAALLLLAYDILQFHSLMLFVFTGVK